MGQLLCPEWYTANEGKHSPGGARLFTLPIYSQMLAGQSALDLKMVLERRSNPINNPAVSYNCFK